MYTMYSIWRCRWHSVCLPLNSNKKVTSNGSSSPFPVEMRSLLDIFNFMNGRKLFFLKAFLLILLFYTKDKVESDHSNSDFKALHSDYHLGFKTLYIIELSATSLPLSPLWRRWHQTFYLLLCPSLSWPFPLRVSAPQWTSWHCTCDKMYDKMYLIDIN